MYRFIKVLVSTFFIFILLNLNVLVNNKVLLGNVTKAVIPNDILSPVPIAIDGTSGHIHKYIWIINKKPSCTSPGTMSWICSGCLNVYRTNTISALGHDFSDATCTAAQICSRCKTVIGKSLGHDFVSATCTEPNKCTRCSTTYGKPLGHDFIEATCTTKKYCTRCDLEEMGALGHFYKYIKFDSNTHIIKCERSGCNLYTTSIHIYENGKCKYCGYIKKIEECSHTYEWEIIKEASCIEAGEKIKKCIKCGYEAERISGYFLEHEYKAEKYDEEYHKVVCEICGLDTEKEKHIFVETKCVICKDERLIEKCKDGNAVAYHNREIKGYNELNDNEHVIKYYCNECKIDFEVVTEHVLDSDRNCKNCAYRYEVCTTEAVLAGHEKYMNLYKYEQLKDEGKHISLYKCGKCDVLIGKVEEHVIVEGKCEKCLITLEAGYAYYSGFGPKVTLNDENGAVSEKGQGLSNSELNKAMNEAEYLDFSVFSAGVGNIDQIISRYKSTVKKANEEGKGPVYMTVRFIEPAVSYVGGVDSLVNKLNNSLSEYKQYITIIVVVGERGETERSGTKKTYNTTIELYYELNGNGENSGFADVKLYAVNQDTVKTDDGKIEVEAERIDYESGKNPHEDAQAAAVESMGIGTTK